MRLKLLGFLILLLAFKKTTPADLIHPVCQEIPCGIPAGDKRIAYSAEQSVISLNEPIVFNEKFIDKLYLSHNGIVGMGHRVPDGVVPLEVFSDPIIAVFFAPVSEGNIYYRVISSNQSLLNEITEKMEKVFKDKVKFHARQAIVITWSDVQDDEKNGPALYQLTILSDRVSTLAWIIYYQTPWSSSMGYHVQTGFGKLNTKETCGPHVEGLVSMSNKSLITQYQYNISDSILRGPLCENEKVFQSSYYYYEIGHEREEEQKGSQEMNSMQNGKSQDAKSFGQQGTVLQTTESKKLIKQISDRQASVDAVCKPYTKSTFLSFGDCFDQYIHCSGNGVNWFAACPIGQSFDRSLEVCSENCGVATTSAPTVVTTTTESKKLIEKQAKKLKAPLVPQEPCNNQQRVRERAYLFCGSSICDKNADCLPNPHGMYICVCMAGFIGNGKTCKNILDNHQNDAASQIAYLSIDQMRDVLFILNDACKPFNWPIFLVFEDCFGHFIYCGLKGTHGVGVCPVGKLFDRSLGICTENCGVARILSHLPIGTIAMASDNAQMLREFEKPFDENSIF